MLFHSYEFLFVFLPVVLAGFLLLEKAGRREAALGWLAVASLFFYGWWSYKDLVLILLSMTVNYAAVRMLSRRPSRTLLAAGIVFNLALIVWFKYAGFLANNVAALTGSSFHLQAIVLPLGISFYTFQQISCLLDAYRGEAKEYSALHYALFVTFFPHLISGPLVHHREMMPQFARGQRVRKTAENIALGLSILVIGLFKKTAIADNLGVFADPVFAGAGRGDHLSFLEAWGGALAYTFQLYFDFSGYSDMAVGAARMFGIVLPLNFNSPYKALNIVEFWRRWHITLSRFLRECLYIPLGGNRKGGVRRYTNLMITMLLGGLWHGAGWTFVAWGGLHGLYLCVNHAWRALKISMQSRAARLLSWGMTFLAVVVAWVFFRAQDFHAALRIFSAMADFRHIVLPREYDRILAPVLPLLASAGIKTGGLFYFYGKAQMFWIAFAAFVAWCLPNIRDFFAGRLVALSDAPAGSGVICWSPSAGWALASALLGIVGLYFVADGYNVFLYFQF
jgi:D-alanyl-lipoteichoic acid acyltransferase DltB (MBOAT superfamily)